MLKKIESIMVLTARTAKILLESRPDRKAPVIPMYSPKQAKLFVPSNPIYFSTRKIRIISWTKMMGYSIYERSA
jgi:hypothetical protein